MPYYLDSWAIGRKRVVSQTGDSYTALFDVIVMAFGYVLLFPLVLIQTMAYRAGEKVVEFDFSGERPMPDYLDIRVDPINQVSADLMFYWIGVYMLMAPY